MCRCAAVRQPWLPASPAAALLCNPLLAATCGCAETTLAHQLTLGDMHESWYLLLDEFFEGSTEHVAPWRVQVSDSACHDMPGIPQHVVLCSALLFLRDCTLRQARKPLCCLPDDGGCTCQHWIYPAGKHANCPSTSSRHPRVSGRHVQHGCAGQ